VRNGGGDPSVVLNNVRDATGNFGFNATTGEFGDMVKMGVIDPAKVTRLALQNAASIAGLLLAAEVAVASG
jgi:chaperonin GroEL